MAQYVDAEILLVPRISHIMIHSVILLLLYSFAVIYLCTLQYSIVCLQVKLTQFQQIKDTLPNFKESQNPDM